MKSTDDILTKRRDTNRKIQRRKCKLRGCISCYREVAACRLGKGHFRHLQSYLHNCPGSYAIGVPRSFWLDCLWIVDRPEPIGTEGGFSFCLTLLTIRAMLQLGRTLDPRRLCGSSITITFPPRDPRVNKAKRSSISILRALSRGRNQTVAGRNHPIVAPANNRFDCAQSRYRVPAFGPTDAIRPF